MMMMMMIRIEFSFMTQGIGRQDSESVICSSTQSTKPAGHDAGCWRSGSSCAQTQNYDADGEELCETEDFWSKSAVILLDEQLTASQTIWECSRHCHWSFSLLDGSSIGLQLDHLLLNVTFIDRTKRHIEDWNINCITGVMFAVLHCNAGKRSSSLLIVSHEFLERF